MWCAGHIHSVFFLAAVGRTRIRLRPKTTKATCPNVIRMNKAAGPKDEINCEAIMGAAIAPKAKKNSGAADKLTRSFELAKKLCACAVATE